MLSQTLGNGLFHSISEFRWGTEQNSWPSDELKTRSEARPARSCDARFVSDHIDTSRTLQQETQATVCGMGSLNKATEAIAICAPVVKRAKPHLACGPTQNNRSTSESSSVICLQHMGMQEPLFFLRSPSKTHRTVNVDCGQKVCEPGPKTQECLWCWWCKAPMLGHKNFDLRRDRASFPAPLSLQVLYIGGSRIGGEVQTWNSSQKRERKIVFEARSQVVLSGVGARNCVCSPMSNFGMDITNLSSCSFSTFLPILNQRFDFSFHV